MNHSIIHACCTNECTLPPTLIDKTQDLEISQKTKELGQQAGIIGYINKLSSNMAASEAEEGAKTSATNAAFGGGSVH